MDNTLTGRKGVKAKERTEDLEKKVLYLEKLVELSGILNQGDPPCQPSPSRISDIPAENQVPNLDRNESELSAFDSKWSGVETAMGSGGWRTLGASPLPVGYICTECAKESGRCGSSRHSLANVDATMQYHWAPSRFNMSYAPYTVFPETGVTVEGFFLFIGP